MANDEDDHKYSLTVSTIKDKLQLHLHHDSMHDDATKDIYHGSFDSDKLKICGFPAKQAQNMETVAKFLESAREGIQQWKFTISIQKAPKNDTVFHWRLQCLMMTLFHWRLQCFYRKQHETKLILSRNTSVKIADKLHISYQGTHGNELQLKLQINILHGNELQINILHGNELQLKLQINILHGNELQLKLQINIL
eukprot:50309_1